MRKQIKSYQHIIKGTLVVVLAFFMSISALGAADENTETKRETRVPISSVIKPGTDNIVPQFDISKKIYELIGLFSPGRRTHGTLVLINDTDHPYTIDPTVQIFANIGLNKEKDQTPENRDRVYREFLLYSFETVENKGEEKPFMAFDNLGRLEQIPNAITGTFPGFSDIQILQPGDSLRVNWTFYFNKDNHNMTMNMGFRFLAGLSGHRSRFGDVNVTYLDANTNQAIADPETITGIVGVAYATDEKTVSGYTFKEVIGNPVGKHTDDTIAVTYVYTQDAPVIKTSTLTVHHEDENGEPLLPAQTTTNHVGEAYTTAQQAIAGYTFKEVKGNPSGTYHEDGHVVRYVYVKVPLPIARSFVIERHLDENGQNLIDPITHQGSVGLPYQMAAKAFPGYTFKEVKGNPLGTYQETDVVVTYVYTKDVPLIKTGTLNVHHVDEDGIALALMERHVRNVGEPYAVSHRLFDGYTLKEIKGNQKGFHHEDGHTLTYVYAKDATPETILSLYVDYVDEQGNHIAPSDTLGGPLASEYTTQAKAIAGYTFKTVEGDPKGTLTQDGLRVVYVYQKNNPTPKPVLPETGVANTLMMVASMAMVGGALVLAIAKRKRKGQR